MVKHIIFTLDGYNFTKNCIRGLYGYNKKDYNPENFEAGDKLWFMTNDSKYHIIGVATFVRFEYRQIGELVAISETNEERSCIVDVYFNNIYNIYDINLNLNDYKCHTSIRNYNPGKKKKNLYLEFDKIYDNIVKYSKVKKIS